MGHLSSPAIHPFFVPEKRLPKGKKLLLWAKLSRHELAIVFERFPLQWRRGQGIELRRRDYEMITKI